jgi:Cu/Ag efflux protein CusF
MEAAAMIRPIAVAILLAGAPLAWAQKPVSESAAVEVTATIDAIDHDNRVITLKDEDGNTETIMAGPQLKRFDELKVGQKVTFRYHESVVYQIRKPGEAAAPTAAGEEKLVRGTGAKPSATVSRQDTATVTVKSIDAKTPAVTVATDDGNLLSMKVNDRKNLEGVKVGDRVEITYTAALAIAVK